MKADKLIKYAILILTIVSKPLLVIKKFTRRILQNQKMQKTLVKLQKGGTGVDLIWHLLQATKEMPAMHDIKILVERVTLHKYLVEQGFPTHNQNKRIELEISVPNSEILVKISIYPNSMHIDIACTDEPFPLMPDGAVKLCQLLDKIRDFLCKESLHQAKIPDVGEWVITHHHRGQDSKVNYDGEKFHITVEKATGGIGRAYSKDRKDGTRIVRIEETRTERIKVSDR